MSLASDFEPHLLCFSTTLSHLQMRWNLKNLAGKSQKSRKRNVKKKMKSHRDGHQRPLQEEDNRSFDSDNFALLNGCASYVGVSAAFPIFWLYEEPCK